MKLRRSPVPHPPLLQACLSEDDHDDGHEDYKESGQESEDEPLEKDKHFKKDLKLVGKNIVLPKGTKRAARSQSDIRRAKRAKGNSWSDNSDEEASKMDVDEEKGEEIGSEEEKGEDNGDEGGTNNGDGDNSYSEKEEAGKDKAKKGEEEEEVSPGATNTFPYFATLLTAPPTHKGP